MFKPDDVLTAIYKKLNADSTLTSTLGYTVYKNKRPLNYSLPCAVVRGLPSGADKFSTTRFLNEVTLYAKNGGYSTPDNKTLSNGLQRVTDILNGLNDTGLNATTFRLMSFYIYQYSPGPMVNEAFKDEHYLMVRFSVFGVER
jgi:hypothetical protein